MSEHTQDLLLQYGQARWTEDLLTEVMLSLSLFEVFEYREVAATLDNLLLDTSETFTSEDQRDLAIINAITKALDAILEAHQTKVFDEATLEERNELLSSLYRIQYYEDVGLICRLLNTECLPEERLARTLTLVSRFSEERILPLLESVPVTTLENFQRYFETRETSEALQHSLEKQQTLQVLRENLADFIQYTGAETLVAQMFESGFEPGYPVSLYHPYVQEMLVTEDATLTAQNLVGLFYFSMDTYTSPTEAFKRYSDQLFESNQFAMKVEAAVRQLVTEFNHYRKAQDDARRISSV